MKKIVISLLLAACLPLVGFAGAAPDGQPPEGAPDFKKHHAHKMEMMVKELGLSAEQKTKVDGIFEDQKTKFKAIHEETKNRLKTVLTPEQLKKFEAMRPPHDKMPEPPKPE
ncbi:hypothetical protein JCM14076_11020 [Methylosoma difficile]